MLGLVHVFHQGPLYNEESVSALCIRWLFGSIVEVMGQKDKSFFFCLLFVLLFFFFRERGRESLKKYTGSFV